MTAIFGTPTCTPTTSRIVGPWLLSFVTPARCTAPPFHDLLEQPAGQGVDFKIWTPDQTSPMFLQHQRYLEQLSYASFCLTHWSQMLATQIQQEREVAHNNLANVAENLEQISQANVWTRHGQLSEATAWKIDRTICADEAHASTDPARFSQSPLPVKPAPQSRNTTVSSSSSSGRPPANQFFFCCFMPGKERKIPGCNHETPSASEHMRWPLPKMTTMKHIFKPIALKNGSPCMSFQYGRQASPVILNVERILLHRDSCMLLAPPNLDMFP